MQPPSDAHVSLRKMTGFSRKTGFANLELMKLIDPMQATR